MIRARSPYIIDINQLGQTTTKLELSLSLTPTFSGVQYTLEKAIPSSNQPACYYDISPYIREYFQHNKYLDITSLTSTSLNDDKVYVRYKRYADGVLIDTIDEIATDGYSEFSDGLNYNGGDYLLDQKNYYYHSGSNPGMILAYVQTGDKVRWSDELGVTYLSASLTQGFYYFPRAYNSRFTERWLTQIIDSGSSVQATWIFYPVEECKYDPVKVDFINRHGAFQREFFFLASNDNVEVTNKDYNLMQPYNYSVTGGQRTTYNQNGLQSIKVNSGWVEEDFKDNLKQLMLSEKVLVDGKPAILKTKSIELNKSINTKQINYSLEFEFAYDLINSIV
jgi:hypothetical protein